LTSRARFGRSAARALGVAACAVVATLTYADRARALEGGVEDRTTTYAVAIATGGPSSPSLRCSGALVAPNVVLTVRHCVTRLAPEGAPSCERSFAEPIGDASDLWVTAMPWTDPSPSWRNVASWVLPAQTAVCGNDLALLVLASPIPAEESTPARPALTHDELRAAIEGRTLGVAGFGATSADGTGEGRRRSRFDIPIHCVPGEPSFSCAGALDYIDVRELTAGAGPCTGDSGAAAIDPRDHGRIFGVLSRGDLTTGTCSEGVFERTDVWAWLIAKTVLEAAPPGVEAPSWARAAFPDAPRAGDFCRGNGSCADDSDCVSFDDRRSFVCARRCSGAGASGSTCGDGEHCEDGVCAPGSPPDPPPEESGCALVRVARARRSRSLSPLGIFAIELALLACARRRRGRSARER
jgi:hypothetical protein